MSRSTFSGPIKAGTNKYNTYANVGTTVLNQYTALTQNGTNAVSQTLYIPAGSRIVNILVDVNVVWNSGTSSTLSVGKTAAGTEYASGVDVKTATGRITPTFTATQLTNMLSTPIDVVATGTYDASSAVVITVTPVGTAATTGTVNVTVFYTQTDDRNTYNTQ